MDFREAPRRGRGRRSPAPSASSFPAFIRVSNRKGVARHRVTPFFFPHPSFTRKLALSLSKFRQSSIVNRKSEIVNLLPHPLPPRPHDGDDDDQHNEDSHQHDPVRGAGDGFVFLEQARQLESALGNGDEERREGQVHGMRSNVKYIT